MSARICKHNELAHQCGMCSRDARIAELKAENLRLTQDLSAGGWDQHSKDVRVAELKEERELVGRMYDTQAKRVAELEAENRLYSESLANATQDIERLCGLCNWAAGRLLDAGDVEGHEKVLAALEQKAA